MAVHFLKQFAGTRDLNFSEAAIRYLLEQPWPNNIRQLRNTIQAVVGLIPTNRQLIQPEDFSYVSSLSEAGPPPDHAGQDTPSEPSLYINLAKYRGQDLRKMQDDIIAIFLESEYQRLGKSWKEVQKHYPSLSRSTIFRKRRKRHSESDGEAGSIKTVSQPSA
ncbi:MAG: hypothetical protein RML57_03540 [Acidobacteriota bacterium]|nr:hypothetical protein [Acidobacteriota bacterium]